MSDGQRLKLCFLASASSVHSYRWVTYFAERGHGVDWLSLSASAFGSDIPGVRLHLAPPTAARARPLVQIAVAAARVRRLVARLRPDVLHAHYAGLNGVVGALAGFRPLVVTAWGSDVLVAGRSRLKGPAVRWALRRADLVTCDAQHMRDAMVGMGVPAERIRVIYFGTDTQRFRPSDDRGALRRALGLADVPTVISLRHLEPVYDVQTLIQAVPVVLLRHPGAHFVVAGTGGQLGTLRDLAAALGVLSRVTFVGALAAEALARYLGAADVYVSTALSDGGLAASTAEAMACAVPVVVTDSGENRRWVEDGVSGFVVPLRTPLALAERVSELLADEDLRARFGKALRVVIETQNNREVEMERMERLYLRLRASRAGA